jgi:mRNA-degrading endonuclease toxin of MazEF toxin-antitoxin module
VDFDPTAGREQRRTRPALVVSSADYLASVREVVVVPIISVDRAWPHHVPVVGERTGLSKPSFCDDRAAAHDLRQQDQPARRHRFRPDPAGGQPVAP